MLHDSLRRIIKAKSDEQLYEMLHERLPSYNGDALKLAAEEYRARADSGSLDVAGLEAAARARERQQERQLRAQEGQLRGKKQAPAFDWTMIFGFGLVVAAMFAFYSLDGIGWVSHQRELPVEISGTWMVGEYRECLLVTGDDPIALNCATGGAHADSHTLSVKFWGRVDRKGSTTGWHCQLAGDALTCWAVN